MDQNEHNETEHPFEKPGRLGRLKEQMYSRFKQPVTRPRRELTELESDAPTNWQRPEPTETAPLEEVTKKVRTYSLPVIVLLVSLGIFVVVGGLAVAYFLAGSNTITSRKIDVVVNGPRTLEGGETLSLQVSVRNNNSATLELADLLITYPEGTREPSDISASLETQRIPLGVIEPGGVRNGVVRGVLFGRNGDVQQIQVELEYRLANSSGVFSTDPVPYNVTLSSSALDISFSTNTEAVAGQLYDITATITSNAKKIMRDVVVFPTYPFGFTVEQSIPEPGKDKLWELGDFEPGDSKTIRIIGTLDGQTGDTRIFRMLAGTRKNANSRLVDVVLADFEHEVVVQRPFLDMALEYDGKPAGEYVAQAGEVVPVMLTWRNNLTVGLTDVVIAATLGGVALDKYNIAVDKGFYHSINSLVTWDKSTTDGALAQVAPGETGTLSLRITPKKTGQLAGVEQPTITFELHAAGQRLAESNVPEIIQATVHEEIKVATNASFVSRALYFENPLGSVGPLPPKVNNETTYGILWEVNNSTNTVKDAVVTATLPPYVRWAGSTSPAGENITFNENDRTIRWYVGKVLPNTGVGSNAPRRVIFLVGLVPSTSQVGKTPELIQQQVFKGTDEFSQTGITKSINDVSIGLREAKFADYYGVVVQ